MKADTYTDRRDNGQILQLNLVFEACVCVYSTEDETNYMEWAAKTHWTCAPWILSQLSGRGKQGNKEMLAVQDAQLYRLSSLSWSSHENYSKVVLVVQTLTQVSLNINLLA